MLQDSWLSCALVSIAFAVLVPLISSTIVVAGASDDAIDLGALENGQLQDEIGENIQIVDNIPTRRLEGLEKFTYQFTHPQFFQHYLRGVVTSFVWLLFATLTASYFGQRHRNDA